MLKRPKGASGKVVVLEHVSKILKGNPLGDPHVRKVAVWLPPQYEAGKRLPKDERNALTREFAELAGPAR